jgi:hypothetical protein
MSTSKVLPVAFLGLAIGCGSAKKDDRAPDDRVEFSGGELAQKIGVQRWVLHGTKGQGELTGFDSPTPDQGKTVVHALFTVDSHGVASVDFDQPEPWHASVSPGGSAASGGDPPASAVLALLSSFDDLPSSPAPSGLVTQAMVGQLQPLDTPYQTYLVECLSQTLLPGVTTYAEAVQAFDDNYKFCDNQPMDQRYKGYKYVGTMLGETQAGKLCDSVHAKIRVCQSRATNDVADDEADDGY